MTALQKTYVTRASIAILGVACLVGGYFGSVSLRQASVHNGDADAPAFKIIERNMILDTAILSVETGSLRSTEIRKIARFLTEEHVGHSRDAASIYFYRPDSNLAKDEPIHKIAWKRSSGYELEY